MSKAASTSAASDEVLTRLRVRDMTLLLAIEAHRSITAAAAELGYTQPAASRTLGDVEQLLRVHLFERDRSKGMRPTPAGQLVLARARALVADCRALSDELDAYRSGTGGRLRLGIIPFVSAVLVEPLIAELTGDVLRMSVAITEGPTTTLLEALQLQRLDAVIGRCSTAPLPAGIEQETLIRQDACLLVHPSNPLARNARMRLADLEGYRWLLPPVGTPTRTAVNAVFARAKLAPPVATVEAYSTRIIHLTLRADTRMLAIVPFDSGHDIQRLGGVKRLPFPVPLQMPAVGLISATRHRETPVVRNLRSALRELLRKRREAA